jgi:hypothetical protein
MRIIAVWCGVYSFPWNAFFLVSAYVYKELRYYGSSMLVLKMQCVRLLGRITNISVLREEAVLHRKVFTMEGSVKGNGVPCSTARDMEQDEVMRSKDFNADVSSEYIE